MLIRDKNLFFNFFVNLCQKELISRIKSELKESMVLEDECYLKMAAP